MNMLIFCTNIYMHIHYGRDHHIYSEENRKAKFMGKEFCTIIIKFEKKLYRNICEKIYIYKYKQYNLINIFNRTFTK